MSQDGSTSTSLLQRALAREPDAWERLVTLYSPLVRHWCRQAGVAHQDMPDVSQDVFAAVSLEPRRASAPTGPARRSGAGCVAWRGTSCWSTSGTVASPPSAGVRCGSGSSRSPSPSDDFELSETPDDLTGLCQRCLAWCGTNSKTVRGARSGA